MSAKFHLLTGNTPFPIGVAWDEAKPSFDALTVVLQSDTANSNMVFSGTLAAYLRYTDPANGDFASVPCQVRAVLDDTETTGLNASFMVSLPAPVTLGTNRKLSLWVQKPPGCNNATSAVRTPTAWQDFYFLRGNFVA